jgi:hypothetical protein
MHDSPKSGYAMKRSNQPTNQSFMFFFSASFSGAFVVTNVPAFAAAVILTVVVELLFVF